MSLLIGDATLLAVLRLKGSPVETFDANRLAIPPLVELNDVGEGGNVAQSTGVLHSGINEIPNSLAGCSDRDAGGGRGRCSDYV